jgi:hypothetical protein
MRVLEGRAEAMAGTFNSQNVANALWAYAKMGWKPGAGRMRVLEGRAEAVAGTFDAQNVAHALWAYATMRREPGAGLMRVLEERTQVIAGTFDAQQVANTLRAYATMGRKPGAKLMRVLEGRAEAMAGTFNVQHVASTLWRHVCLPHFELSRKEVDGCRRCCSAWCPWARRSASTPAMSCELCQFYQLFLWLSLEPRRRVEAINHLRSINDLRSTTRSINDLRSLKAAWRSAFGVRRSAFGVRVQRDSSVSDPAAK